MAKIQKGCDGESLPEKVGIFRIGRDSHLNHVAENRDKPLPVIFELSSKEKAQQEPRLSVWVEELTIADQAWGFMGGNPKNTIVACLDTESVRNLRVQEAEQNLDVQWEQAFFDDDSGNKIRNDLPGSDGHCGIAGLMRALKSDRKMIRSKLADASTVSPVRVPHPFRDDEIRPIAHQRWQISGCDDAEGNWIEAVREARRKAAAVGRLSRKDNAIAADGAGSDASFA